MNKLVIFGIILMILGAGSAITWSSWFWFFLIVFPIIAINNFYLKGKRLVSDTPNVVLVIIISFVIFFISIIGIEEGSLSLGGCVTYIYILTFLLIASKLLTNRNWLLIIFLILSLFIAGYITSSINTYMTNIYKANEAKRIAHEQSIQDKIKNVNTSIIKKAKEDHTTIPIFSGSFMKIHSYGTATGSDEALIYLKQIERENQYNQQFIKDVENTQIHSDYIELMSSGIIINRHLGMIHSRMEDIFTSSGNTILFWSDKNKKSNLFTRENFDTFSSNIPGSGSLEKKQNLAKFLNLQYE